MTGEMVQAGKIGILVKVRYFISQQLRQLSGSG